MRAKAAAHINTGDGIKWRSHEPSRIETFSDAAFAFALTLIIISMEVPKTFDMLVETMKGTLSFAVCFGLLFNIWNSQNIFFRRYGLTDSYIVALNAILLFVVLVYTYPLKFLFELIFSDDKTQATMIHGSQQLRLLMLIYSVGFIAIYTLFYLMYRHAKKLAAELELTPAEIYATDTVKYINLICICICFVAIAVALILPNAGPSGFVYCTFPIAYSVWFSYRGKKGRELFPKSA